MVARRIRAWFESRLPRSDRWTLTQRNLYILPTKAGWGFCITLLVMLLASINYQLNLGYGLTFLLGGAALAAIHQTHGNLRRLTLHVRPPAPVFAGEAATLEVVLDNPGPARHGLGLGLHAAGPAGLAFCDVPALGSTVARLRYTPPRRGQHVLPTLLLESHFPLGLFRVWTLWRPAALAWVYPAPERPAPALPVPQAGSEGPLQARRASGAEFDGVRAYQRGDTLRQVVWKKSARSGEWVSRDTSTTLARTLLLLDYADTGSLSPEARLSRLTAWVLAAEQDGRSYGLALPGQRLAPGSGEAHRSSALQALALWPAAGAPPPVHTAGAGQ